MGKSDNTADPASTRKITLSDGFQVGISNLDTILKEVAALKLTDPARIREELIERVRACNFVASGAENEYRAALYREFLQKFDESGEGGGKHRIEPKKPHAG